MNGVRGGVGGGGGGRVRSGGGGKGWCGIIDKCKYIIFVWNDAHTHSARRLLGDQKHEKISK